MDSVDRRHFLKSAGLTGGAIAVLGAPGIAQAAGDHHAEVVDSPSALAHEPVVVFVRDAVRGEVTVMHGTRETTYRDRVLVRRLRKAAGAKGEAR